ncbi:MAG: HNH endonuclease [Phycisphaerales bacterium]
MAKKIPSCYNCVFAYLDQEITLRCYTVGFLNWPACANHPESYGRMKRTPRCGICPNYRPETETPQGDVRQIALGDGFTAYVDAADYEWLNQWTWCLCNGYAARRNKETWTYMHREIIKAPRGMDVDHKNHNRLDNTRENLRVCTRAENIWNRRKPRNTSSRFWGVSYIKARARYMAFVSHERKVISCGCFLKELDAARAHDAKAVELFGELARLNFPEEWPPERRAAVANEKAKEAKAKGGRGSRNSRRGDACVALAGKRPRTAKKKKSHAETQGRRGSRKTEDRRQRTAREKNRKSRVEPPRRKRRVGS